MKLVNKLLAPVNATVISILGLGQVLTGFWLILPYDSWMLYTATMIPEPVIGSILLVIGLGITTFSLLLNLKALQWSSTAGYLFWFMTTIAMFIVHMSGTGWIFSLIFAVFCFIISLNIRVNRKWMR